MTTRSLIAALSVACALACGGVATPDGPASVPSGTFYAACDAYDLTFIQLSAGSCSFGSNLCEGGNEDPCSLADNGDGTHTLSVDGNGVYSLTVLDEDTLQVSGRGADMLTCGNCPASFVMGRRP